MISFQVVEGVRAQGELNFDFVALILLAGMIAALGLMDNSVVSIIAAMLVSPLMVSELAASRESLPRLGRAGDASRVPIVADRFCCPMQCIQPQRDWRNLVGDRESPRVRRRGARVMHSAVSRATLGVRRRLPVRPRA